MSTQINPLKGIAFLSFPEQTELLKSELAGRFNFCDSPDEAYGELLYFSDKALFLNSANANKTASMSTETSSGQPFNTNIYPYWARTVMEEPFILKFDSIGEAASELKKIQRNWAPYQFTCFRRSNLIQEKLPYINLKPRNFPASIPASPIGLYTLIDEHTIIASAKTSSFLPAGALNFVEDHENPPSRAYLKIQESLCLAKLYFDAELPSQNSSCFEAGACPGGWTWVLVQLGSRVFAVDRAELAPELMKNPLVKFMAHDAFTLKPEDIGKMDWVLSDVICYPERLLEWIKRWLSSALVKNMICTIKMQGEINWPLISEFAAIPDSKVVHLNYNKHELTWIHCEK